MKKIIQKIILFTLLVAPLVLLASHYVITSNASNIGTNQATLNGTITANHGMSWAKFRYSTSNASSCQEMTGYVEVNASLDPVGYGNVRRMHSTIVGLQQNTTYYFCAMARAHNLTEYGSVVSFGTHPPIVQNDPGNYNTGPGTVPYIEGATEIGQVTTVGSENINDVQATFNGSVSGISGGAAYGYFRYSSMKVPPIFCNDIFGSNMQSATAGATLANHNPSGQINNGNFSSVVSKLQPSTTYYYCAVASNHPNAPTIIKYGQVKSFTTTPCATCPHTKITTSSAIVTGPNSAILRGEYGSSKNVATYFEYKPTTIQTDWTKTAEEIQSANSYGKITSELRGLRADTQYVFRAWGRTSDPTQTFHGANLFFRTGTFDGLGDGEGWIYDGEIPWENYDSPFDLDDCDPATEDCDGGGYDNCDPATQNCDDDPYDNCDPEVEDCDGGYDECNPVTEDCDSGYGDCDPATEDCNGGGYEDCNPATEDCDGGGYGGYTPIDYTGVGNGIGSGNGDFDGDGVTNNNDTDIDGDGVGNVGDNDSDGDGIGNGFDSDDDNDGIFDSSDQTPLGNGSNSSDLDGDGLSNSVDTDDDGDGIPDISDPTPFGTGSSVNDLDGDGINNSIDTDIDGDGIPNNTDPDDDNDGLPDHLDNSASGNNFGGGNGGQGGGNQNQGDTLGVGDETTPPQDAIVRYHEGVETVFIRQIMRNTTLAKKYGYRDGEDLQKFSWYLAHFLGKSYGYVAKNKKEVRVRFADVAAYELREVGNTTTVYESYDNAGNGKFKITGVRKLNSLFKMVFKYEYYFLKRR